MDVAEAKTLLSKPLKFGDSEQIMAVRFLEKVDFCKEKIADCKNVHNVSNLCDECGGSGLCECDCGDEHDCGECDGEGMTCENGIRYCECVENFDMEVVGAAIGELRARR